MTATLENRTSRALCLAVLLTTSLCLAGQAMAAEDPIVCIPRGQFVPPAPAPMPTPLVTGLPRRVYEGATPPALDPTRPVLVFVHGLHGSAATWVFEATSYYGHNDMYDAAYEAGYKVFLVDLWDAQGTAETSIKNGQLLKQQLDWIAQYWGVEKVNIIAHSKGGPDSNVAAFLGAPVDSIVTLSGAHWGSPLADLAQSGWLEWLAELLGSNDPGTKFLQTACMELVRGVLDADPGNEELSIYTTAGTGWGPLLSALRLGGLYLATVCPAGGNDGLVCVEHASHPWARDAVGVVSGEHRVVWDRQTGDYEVDHDGIRMGNNLQDFFWPWEPNDCFVPILKSIEPYAGTFHQAGPATRAVAKTAAPRRHHQALILRGGPLANGVTSTVFPIEPGVEGAYLRVLTSGQQVEVTLVDPQGRRRRLPRSVVESTPILPGAFGTGGEMARPPAGDWRVELKSPNGGAFALLLVVDSSLDVRLELRVDAAGRRFVDLKTPPGSDAEMSVSVRRTSLGAENRQIDRLVRTGDGSTEIELLESGVYNLSITIRGSYQGLPFERNGVLSLATAPEPSAGLPAVCR